MGRNNPRTSCVRPPEGKSGQFEKVMAVIQKTHEINSAGNQNSLDNPHFCDLQRQYMHLADIHRLVLDTTQLHPYYFGWFITEERAALHEKVFKERFGFAPKNHRGYLKSCFTTLTRMSRPANSRNHPHVKGHASVPQFLPDITTEVQVRRYLQRPHMGLRLSRMRKHLLHRGNLPRWPRYAVPRLPGLFRRQYQPNKSFYDIWNGETLKRSGRDAKGLMPVCTRCCGLQGF